MQIANNRGPLNRSFSLVLVQLPTDLINRVTRSLRLDQNRSEATAFNVPVFCDREAVASLLF